MASITEDVIQGSSFSVKGNIIRVFTVRELAAGPSVQQLAAFAVDGTTGRRVPRLKDGHPTYAGYIADDVVATPLMNSKTAARVVVTYKPIEITDAQKTPEQVLGEGGILVRITSGTSNGTTQIDQEGGPVRVVYQIAKDGKPLPAGFKPEYSRTDPYQTSQIKTSEIPTPNSFIEIVRREAKTPFKLNLKYRTKLNSKPIWGCEARSLLFMGVSDSFEIPGASGGIVSPGSAGGKIKHDVHYQFEHRQLPPDGPGFEALQLYKDPRTGEPPPDIDPKRDGWPKKKGGNGWAEYRVLKEADFADLKLPDWTAY